MWKGGTGRVIVIGNVLIKGINEEDLSDVCGKVVQDVLFID
jgi:hypothetical protein